MTSTAPSPTAPSPSASSSPGSSSPDTRDACLLIFTKPAVPGRVKTRLIDPLTPDQTARLHAAFLEDVLAALSSSSGERTFDLRLAWALEEGEGVPPAPEPFAHLAGERQEGGDLGERLYRSLARAAESHSQVAAVGSDHPTLGRERVEDAFRRLREGAADVVLGPADDGGYYLVAVGREALVPEIFRDIPWSTSEVLSVTEERLRSAGLRWERLPVGEDVDTPADLEALVRRLAEDEGHADARARCLRTRAVLRDWGML